MNLFRGLAMAPRASRSLRRPGHSTTPHKKIAFRPCLETLEEIVDKVREVKRAEELKPLAASIAHNLSVSRLRERFAKKRGAVYFFP